MSRPYIVRGWWNDINNCKKNFGKTNINTFKALPFIKMDIEVNYGQFISYVEKHKDNSFLFI